MIPDMTPELADAIDKYQTTFDRSLGILCVQHMPVSALLRRIKEALEAGVPIPEDDYTFYLKLSPGEILAPSEFR